MGIIGNMIPDIIKTIDLNTVLSISRIQEK